MKRTLTVLICGLLLVGVVGGALAQESVPPRPVITMHDAEDTVYEGLPGAFCWLQARNDIRCEPGPLDLEPETFEAVTQGDVLTFVIASESGTPRAFSATLLDDFDADGDPLLVEFDPAEEAEYTVDLDPGEHRISLLAEYDLAEVPGDNSFVTYVFGLDVSAGDSEVTPRPSATPPPTEDKPEATVEATDELPTMSDDELAQTATAINEFLIGTEVPATEEATEVVTEEATEAPTATPTTAPSDTPQPPPTATTPPTATSSLPPSPTAIPPSPTTGFSGGPSPTSMAPEVVVVNGLDTFGPSGVEYCHLEGGEQVCEAEPATAESRRILVSSGDTLRIDFAEGGPITARIGLYNNNATVELSGGDTLNNPTVTLYVVTGQPGNYILQVQAAWTSDTSAIYFFRLQIAP